MKQITYKEIVTDELAKDAIINNQHDGFRQDYLVLHCLLKKYSSHIKRFLEVGTNSGMGTKIIKNSLGNNSEVYTLDLPKELQHVSNEYPGAGLAKMCDLPFKQLYGDSTKFDYTKIYPIDGWFVDAKHSYDNVLHESAEAIKSKSKLIMYHDADQTEVYRGIWDAFKNNVDYELFRVTGTRIAYAIRKK